MGTDERLWTTIKQLRWQPATCRISLTTKPQVPASNHLRLRSEWTLSALWIPVLRDSNKPGASTFRDNCPVPAVLYFIRGSLGRSVRTYRRERFGTGYVRPR